MMCISIKNKNIKIMEAMIFKHQPQTPLELAYVIFQIYDNQYCCSNIKNNVWCVYCEGKWITEPLFTETIQPLIAQELISIYCRLIGASIRENHLEIAINFLNMLEKINNDELFMKQVWRECLLMFYKNKI